MSIELNLTHQLLSEAQARREKRPVIFSSNPLLSSGYPPSWCATPLTRCVRDDGLLRQVAQF